MKDEDELSLFRTPINTKFIEKVKSKNRYIKKFIVFKDNTAIKLTNIKPLYYNPTISDAVIISFSFKHTYIITTGVIEC